MLDGRQEARVAVLEQLVEGPARNPRARDDVRDGDLADTQLADQLHHRTQDPSALQLADPSLTDTTDETGAGRGRAARAPISDRTRSAAAGAFPCPVVRCRRHLESRGEPPLPSLAPELGLALDLGLGFGLRLAFDLALALDLRLALGLGGLPRGSLGFGIDEAKIAA